MALSADRARRGRRARSVDTAYRHLRELIVHGRLAPGTRLVEADLARRLGVSRTPVRSALHRLQQEGYVIASNHLRQSRLTVAPLTKEDARELYWIVGHIEGLAARLAATQPPEMRARLVASLRALNSRLARLAQAGRNQPAAIFDVDMSFHRRMVEASAGPRLLALHDAIKPQTERYWRLYASAIIEELGQSVQEHERILEALEQGDADAAELAVRVNWSNGAERLCHVIDSLGERGSW